MLDKGLGSHPDDESDVWWYLIGCVIMYATVCTVYVTWRLLCVLNDILRQLFS